MYFAFEKFRFCPRWIFFQIIYAILFLAIFFYLTCASFLVFTFVAGTAFVATATAAAAGGGGAIVVVVFTAAAFSN